MMQQFPGVVINHNAVSYIHLLGGTIYTVDPIVYILVRKTNRKRLVELFCGACNRENLPEQK
ncbi:hypothetical protein DPMN_123116 [Dreissena polymorpha]|uniref:Uncharacterized protein n=1 Tax=Dreissena polymorpha TaxID=45954 RepID=A0A9D4GR00_DREPO|nr:hypothetical protein DPMN_123116 [Dreissena polymorpha]